MSASPTLAPIGSRTPASLRAVIWLWLGAWIGAMALFGWVARAAFRVVPDPSVAGHLIGTLLDPMLAAGAISGIGLSALAVRLQSGRVTIVLPLVLTTACLINQFGVSRAVAEIQLSDPGLSPELAARFSALHRLSVWLFVGTGLGTLVLGVAHALAQGREARAGSPTAISLS